MYIDFEEWTLEELKRTLKAVDKLSGYDLRVVYECSLGKNRLTREGISDILKRAKC